MIVADVRPPAAGVDVPAQGVAEALRVGAAAARRQEAADGGLRGAEGRRGGAELKIRRRALSSQSIRTALRYSVLRRLLERS